MVEMRGNVATTEGKTEWGGETWSRTNQGGRRAGPAVAIVPPRVVVIVGPENCADTMIWAASLRDDAAPRRLPWAHVFNKCLVAWRAYL